MYYDISLGRQVDQDQNIKERGVEMNIKKITMKNFRCFTEQEISLNSKFNLIVGNNGFGKSTILEALSIGISGYLNEIKSLLPNDKRNITQDDVRIKRNPISELTEFQSIYPVELNYTVEFNSTEYNYSRIKKQKGSNTTFGEDTKIKKLSSEANKTLENGIKNILPAFAYHGTGRVWAKSSVPNKDFETNNRVFGYKNCINPMSNEKQYVKWMEDMRAFEIDEGVESVELQTLYRAAEKFLGEGSKVRFQKKENQIMITLPSKRMMHYSKLSDGYKNALGIVFDTAFRMIKLNPWLKESAIDETPGIILIDEIDLHLHPSWQKRIVTDMKNTFPKMQIIATTHAPIVVSSCNKDELIILDAELDDNLDSVVSVKNSEISTKGWLAENILADIMGVPTSRDEETEAEIKRFRELYEKKFRNKITDAEVNELKNLKERLEKKLPSEDPLITLIGFEAYEKSLEG